MKRLLPGLALFSLLLSSPLFAGDGPDREEVKIPSPYVVAHASKLAKTSVVATVAAEIGKRRNLVWCVTMQLAWKELEKAVGGPVVLEPMPELARRFNETALESGVLDEASYVARAGRSIEKAILEEIEKKFQGKVKPRLLGGDTVAYALLHKQLPFEWAFNRFGEYHLRFGSLSVESFGIEQFDYDDEAEMKMAEQVLIMDYVNENDFVIELKVAGKKDCLILAKTPPKKTLAETVASVLERHSKGKAGPLKSMEDFYVPVIDFEITKDFEEFSGARFVCENPDLKGRALAGARQLTRFRLDEKGAVIECESSYYLGETPRSFVFDKPFLVLLKRRKAKTPYFALWIANGELLIPVPKTEED
jgi:hypothetical protein